MNDGSINTKSLNDQVSQEYFYDPYENEVDGFESKLKSS